MFFQQNSKTLTENILFRNCTQCFITEICIVWQPSKILKTLPTMLKILNWNSGSQNAIKLFHCNFRWTITVQAHLTANYKVICMRSVWKQTQRTSSGPRPPLSIQIISSHETRDGAETAPSVENFRKVERMWMRGPRLRKVGFGWIIF